MTKYKISDSDISTPGGITKLERDGFSRTEIMDAVHKKTDDMVWDHRNRTSQRELVQELFDRHKS